MNQIQGRWKRLKLQSKKEHDLQRRVARKTGGGKAPASPNKVGKLKKWSGMLGVRLSSYRCTREVGRAREKRLSGTSRRRVLL